jgi:hypothetical protein
VSWDIELPLVKVGAPVITDADDPDDTDVLDPEVEAVLVVDAVSVCALEPVEALVDVRAERSGRDGDADDIMRVTDYWNERRCIR